MELFCANCGEKLEHDEKNGEIEVIPCEECIKESFTDGFDDGREEGYLEGITENDTPTNP